MKKLKFLMSMLFLLNSLYAFAEPEAEKLILKMSSDLNIHKAVSAKKPINKPVPKKPVVSKPIAPKPVDKTPIQEIQIEKPLEMVVVPVVQKVVEAPPEIVPEVKKDNYPMSEILKMENDKEVILNAFDNLEKERILNKFNISTDKEKFKTVYYSAVFKFLNSDDAKCETNLIAELIFQLGKQNVVKTEPEVLDAIKFLRVTNVIDDIAYEILENLSKDYFVLRSIDFKEEPRENPFKDYNKKAEGFNLEVFFKEFKKTPDEKTKCVYREYSRLQKAVGERKDSLKTRNKIIKDLALKAYKDNVIELRSYNVIKFLGTQSTLNTRTIWLNDYVETIINAKNKMVSNRNKYKVVNLEDENKYTSERKDRFRKITLRKSLYQKYDANQIVLLAQVMKKASQRMGVDADTRTGAAYIVQEFQDLNDDKNENYVERIELDTQSQFNLARRLLRKDLVKLQMMDSFLELKITYDDLVTASVETGYISLDDLVYVVKYDDLWNPEISKNQKLINMGFRITGYATFFLPPPWNVTGALALSIIEGIVDSKTVKGVENDNPNTIIE